MSSIDRQPLVMLVDDSDIDLFLNRKFLNAGGITENTISFPAAEEALDYLKSNADKPDLLPKVILLDILMPEINGFDFADIFQSLPEKIKSGIKIILLSSTVDPVDQDRAKEHACVVDILKKPLDTALLKKILQHENIIKAA